MYTISALQITKVITGKPNVVIRISIRDMHPAVPRHAYDGTVRIRDLEAKDDGTYALKPSSIKRLVEEAKIDFAERYTSLLITYYALEHGIPAPLRSRDWEWNRVILAPPRVAPGGINTLYAQMFQNVPTPLPHDNLTTVEAVNWPLNFDPPPE